MVYLARSAQGFASAVDVALMGAMSVNMGLPDLLMTVIVFYILYRLHNWYINKDPNKIISASES